MIMARTGASQTVTVQRRKTHNKSRYGCRNCKIRKVKVGRTFPVVEYRKASLIHILIQCDESRPHCQKCSDYGVVCNYNNPLAPNLQMIGATTQRSPPLEMYGRSPYTRGI